MNGNPNHENGRKDDEVDFIMVEFSKQMKKAIFEEDGYEYFPNHFQQIKFSALVKFLNDKAKESGDAEVMPIEIIPKEMCGGIDANFLFFSLNGEEEVDKFNKLLSYCSAFSVCPTNDGRTRLSFTVPYLFNRRKK